jgi:hypothetical protein
MKLVMISIKSCFHCPKRKGSFIAAPNSLDSLDECTETSPVRLIQRPDEEDDFPTWCPLPAPSTTT